MPRNALVQVRRDTAANWTSVNPTLAAGELGLETDTGKFKVGTGSAAWTALTYGTDASKITGTTLASNVTGSSLTSVGTITSGTWSGSFGAVSGANLTTLNASNISSGTLASARLSGSYTGISAVGTLTGLTIGGAGNNRSITIDAPTGYYAIQYFAINGTNKWHYEVTPSGLSWSLVESGVAARLTVDTNKMYFNGTNASSPQMEIGDWNQDGRYSAVRTNIGYLLLGATGVSTSIYLRTEAGQGNVYIGGQNTNTLEVTTNSATVTGNLYATNIVQANNQLISVGATLVYGAGIAYYGATVGGGSQNQIGFRWASPYVNCTVDNVISAICANFSDRRLKTDIVPFNDGIDMVRRLRPVRYNPLDVIGFDPETYEPIIGDSEPYDEMLGFIADEVEEIYQSAVRGRGAEIKSIDNVQVLSMAISAIQQLDSRLQVLENTNG